MELIGLNGKKGSSWKSGLRYVLCYFWSSIRCRSDATGIMRLASLNVCFVTNSILFLSFTPLFISVSKNWPLKNVNHHFNMTLKNNWGWVQKQIMQMCRVPSVANSPNSAIYLYCKQKEFYFSFQNWRACEINLCIITIYKLSKFNTSF